MFKFLQLKNGYFGLAWINRYIVISLDTGED